MQFAFRLMEERDARAVAAWHYDDPYSFYNMEDSPESLAELLDPATWESCFAVTDDDGDLVGFFQFQPDGDIFEIGLGLRPDLTGKGFGMGFVQAGLDFARAAFAPTTFRLDVATFNRRAIAVYERAGFRLERIFMHESRGVEHEFQSMVRPA